MCCRNAAQDLNPTVVCLLDLGTALPWATIQGVWAEVKIIAAASSPALLLGQGHGGGAQGQPHGLCWEKTAIRTDPPFSSHPPSLGLLVWTRPSQRQGMSKATP